MIKTVRAHQPWSNLYFFFCDHPTLFIIFYLSFNHIWDDSLCSKSSFPFPSFPLLAIFSPFLQTESLFTGNVWWALLPGRVDLPQVDLLASGASLFWPQSGRPLAMKSREVVPCHMKSGEGLFWKSTGREREKRARWEILHRLSCQFYFHRQVYTYFANSACF